MSFIGSSPPKPVNSNSEIGANARTPWLLGYKIDHCAFLFSFVLGAFKERGVFGGLSSAGYIQRLPGFIQNRYDRFDRTWMRTRIVMYSRVFVSCEVACDLRGLRLFKASSILLLKKDSGHIRFQKRKNSSVNF